MCHLVLHSGLARAEHTSMNPVKLLRMPLRAVWVLHTCVRVREEVCTHKRPRRMPESIYHKTSVWYRDACRHLDCAQLRRSLDLDIWAGASCSTSQCSQHQTIMRCCPGGTLELALVTQSPSLALALLHLVVRGEVTCCAAHQVGPAVRATP